MKMISGQNLARGLNEQIEGSLRRDYPSHFKIYQSLFRQDILPKAADCIRLMEKIDKSYGAGAYAGLLHSHGHYQIVHDRLVRNLSNLILQLKAKSCIEICAGRGKLSYWLSREGIEIIPTDPKARKGTGVKRLDYREALRRYEPDLVLAAWPKPDGITLVLDTIKRRSVKEFIVLGKGGRLAREHWKRILEHAQIVPIELDTFPSHADSLVNSHGYGKGVANVIRRKYQVGKSKQLFQSVLFRKHQKGPNSIINEE